MKPTLPKIDLWPAGDPFRLPKPDGFTAACTSITHEGEAIRLLIPDSRVHEVFARYERQKASFPKTSSGIPYSPIVSVTGNSGSSETLLPALGGTYPGIEVLPGKRFLFFAHRVIREADGSYCPNGRVFGPEGHLEREFLLGDGIEHVQTDAAGRIWVGYFDEGVFGNFGWGDDNERLGIAGLSCFDSAGRKIWDYQSPEGFDSIADCYALNVTRSGVWAYYYQDFAFAHIDQDWNISCRRSNYSGARTFAVDGDKVLLYGGYGDQKASCHLLQLEEDELRVQAQVFLQLPRALDLSRDRIIGRDKYLYAILEDECFFFSMDE